MFTAALDTNVLWPSLCRDFLLCLAVEGLYRPVWSEQTLEELHYCERRKLIKRGTDPDEAETSATRLVTLMRREFDDALITESRTRIVGPFDLPDPADEHVLAGAILGGAQVIVTENGKHFPAAKMPTGITVSNTADFARDTVSVDPDRALETVLAMAERRSRTPIDDVLTALEDRYELYEACALLRDALLT